MRKGFERYSAVFLNKLARDIVEIAERAGFAPGTQLRTFIGALEDAASEHIDYTLRFLLPPIEEKKDVEETPGN